MSTLSLSEAREQLVAGGVTGPHHSHSRQNTVAKTKALVEGDPDGSFGLSGVDRYSAGEVLGFLAELTGCSSDVTDLEGFDTIDPDKTMAGIVAAARRLLSEASRGATLLTVTGHPTGMLEHHIRVVDAYRKAGGKVLRLREEESLAVSAGRHFEVRYVGNVGCVADWGSLRHTHSSKAMEALLEAEPWPDLVLGDHGFAGAAIERGIPTIAVMDINDPALAVAWAEKKDVVIVPMDDNRPQRLYEPSWRIFEQILGGEEL
jgi:histidinol phosphate phosphatase hisN-like protein